MFVSALKNIYEIPPVFILRLLRPDREQGAEKLVRGRSSQVVCHQGETGRAAAAHDTISGRRQGLCVQTASCAWLDTV